ncbi:MAG: RagB/SusD family nutrient uptake outer membrane protein, partial [Bacteroidales bacterium]|nr:RagB/SusD family nutrient uptake outer membrane protein [Bacteroidales bacterium]
MKKIALYLLIALGAAAMTVSCTDEYLNVDYYSIVNPDGVYEDADNVFMGLTGVYSILYATGDYYIKPHPALANMPTLDLQADGWDAEMPKHAWGVESKSAFFENAWKYSYRMVSRANLYLADLEKVRDEVVPEATRRIYESEARCLRAAAYYYLTINFSRVPMLMTGETYANSPEKARPESDEAAWTT